MRDENYFEVKLQMSKDKLIMAKSMIDHLDNQIINLKVRFDHDQKVYNDQIIHMQDVITEMKKRIPKLQKRLNKGYKVFDVRADKGYKSFDDMHKAQLETQRQKTLELQRLLEEKYEKRKALKEDPPNKLTEADKEIIESIKVRESLQGEDEIKESQEQQIENIQKKREALERQLEELGAVLKETNATDIKFDTVGNEIRGMKLEELEVALEKDIVILPEKKVIPHIEIVKTPNDDLNQLKSISQQIGEHKTEINGRIKEIEWLKAKHPEWIDSYGLEEGGKAIYSGRITNGFRSWCEEKGYKIGD